MRLSFPAKTALTFGGVLVVASVVLFFILGSLGPPDVLVDHVSGRGLKYLAFALSNVPEPNRARVLEQAREHFNMPIEMQSVEASTTDRPGFVISVPIDERTNLVAGPMRPPPPPGQPVLIVIAVLGTSLAIGALAVARPIQKRLGSLERRIVDLAGAGYLASTGPSDLEQVEHVLDWAKEQISKKEQERSAFLQALAHEIRTPLARVGFALEKLSLHPEQTHETVEGIQREISELSELSSELSDWVRDDAQIEPPIRFDLGDLLRICVDLERDRHGSNEIEVTVESTDQLEIRGMRRELNRAVENVVRNALSFARSKVRIVLDRRPGGARILVEDDGPGIPEEDRRKVLEPFVSLAADGDARMGLGFSIAARAVSRHGGSIAINDASIGGAAVELLLPAKL